MIRPRRIPPKPRSPLATASSTWDGFGLAVYTPTNTFFTHHVPGTADTAVLHPMLYKNAQPPLHDPNFRSLCANMSTLTLCAHIRAATTSPVVPTNNHPFAFGRHTLMHNGYISSFTAVRRALAERASDAAYANIAGSTDSEHLAALYMTILCGPKAGPDAWERRYPLAEMRSALERSIELIITTQRELLGTGADGASPNDLNVAITDGNTMLAIRFRNHATQQPPSPVPEREGRSHAQSQVPGTSGRR